MAAMRGEQYPVAGMKLPVGILAFDTQSRAARDQQHPFVAVLIVPLAFPSRLAGRDDALDAERQPLKKAIDTFVTGRSIREIGVKTSCPYRHMSTAPRHAVSSARAVARPATSTTNARIAVSLIPRIP